jgi:hypothetical protein
MLIHGPKKKFWIPQSPALWIKASGGGGGPIVPAFVQQNKTQNGATSSTTVAVTLTNPVGVGNTICAVYGAGGPGAAGNPLTIMGDNKANSYAPEFGFNNAANNFFFGSAVSTGITNGPTIFTVTWVGSLPFGSLLIAEYSGILASGAVDGTPAVQTQLNPAVAANAVTSGNTTSANSGGLVFGAICNLTGNGTQSPGSGFTSDISIPSVFLIEHLVQGAAGAIAATATPTALDEWISGVYVLKHA